MSWLIVTTLLLAQDAAPAAAKVATPAPAADAPAAPIVVKGGSKAAAPAPAPASDNSLPMITFIAPAILFFYILVLRPQQQQDKKRKQLIAGIKKNDKVLTGAGIYGTVVSVDATADKVVLRLDDDKNVKFTFSKASIVRVIDPSEKTAETSSS